MRDLFRSPVQSLVTFARVSLVSFRPFEGTIFSVFIPYSFKNCPQFARLSFENVFKQITH